MPRQWFAAVVALALVMGSGPLPSVHTHETGEQDLRPHDHRDGAVLLESVEDCGGAAHLHPVEHLRHVACPACLTACGNASSMWGTVPIGPEPSASGRLAALHARAGWGRAVRAASGRAPPRA